MEGRGLHVFTTHPCAEECRSCWEPVGCTHPTIAGFTSLYKCWKNLRNAPFCATFRGGQSLSTGERGVSQIWAAQGDRNYPVGFSGVGLHRGAGRTRAATVRQRFCSLCLCEVFFIGITPRAVHRKLRAVHRKPRALPLGFVVVAFQADGVASKFTTSSFPSDDGLKSCIKSLFAPKNVVIRKCFCCKEMTTMTTFWGVSSSCSHDWHTKVSASVPGLRARVWFDELGVRTAAA